MVGKPPLETAGDAVCLIKAGLRLEHRQTASLLDRTKLQPCLYEDEKLNDFPRRRSSCCLCCSATSPHFSVEGSSSFIPCDTWGNVGFSHRYTFQMWAALRRKMATWVNLFEHLRRLRLNRTLGSETCQHQSRGRQDITYLKPRGNLWKPLMALSVRKLWNIVDHRSVSPPVNTQRDVVWRTCFGDIMQKT